VLPLTHFLRIVRGILLKGNGVFVAIIGHPTLGCLPEKA
jgi:hypothetical protein